MADDTIEKIEEIIIYESPDGGKTVYGRKMGDSAEARMLFRSEAGATYLDAFEYLHACDMAPESEVIKDALERLQAAYALTQKDLL